jgi:F-type H+-transporting ATPase subunit a
MKKRLNLWTFKKMPKLTMLRITKEILFLIVFSLITLGVTAQHQTEESSQVSDSLSSENSHHTETNSEGIFNAGKFVIEHVSDSYEWHITTIGETHFSVPLPIILYTQKPELHNGKTFHIFMSSKFHHGNADYAGFRISRNKEFEGKIVELSGNGDELGKPIDISITKTVTGVLVSVIVLLWVFLAVAKSAKQNKGKAPKGLQNIVEPIILFIRDEIAKPSIGDKKFEKYMPFLLTVFFFILINNFLGLIPIFPFGANITGNISVTFVLALFTFMLTTISGNKHYWKEIYNPEVPWWLKFPIPLMPIVELSGVITKPFVLMVRLFANMLAGHMIVTVFVSLIFILTGLFGIGVGLAASPVSVLFSVFILLLDVLVSFIQAYVFTMLSAMYFGMATTDHH